MIEAIFFDLDGTLLSHTDLKVPKSTKGALKQLKENNIACILCTGRHLQELEELPVEDLDFDGYILLNGQISLDSKKQKEISNPIQNPAFTKIIEVFNEKKTAMMLVEENRMYMNFVNDAVVQAQNAIHTSIPPVQKYSGSEIYQAIVYVNQEGEEILKKKLAECTFTRWNEFGVDILPSGSGKLKGISQYLSMHEIDPAHIMAFGDDENDLEMIRFAKIGVAMGNAKDSIKKAADYITEHVDEDGLHKALIHFGLIR